MHVEEWDRARALGPVDPDTSDDLADVSVLVLDGIDADDDDRLGWCRRAPCIVVAVAGDGPASGAVDAVIGEVAGAVRLDDLVAATSDVPQAALTLVQVLRVVDGLAVDDALTVESLAYSMLQSGPEHRRWLERSERTPRSKRSGAPLRLERDAERLTIVLTQPERRNPLGAETRDALVEAFALAEADATIREVVLRGEGPVFCSGGDLDEFGTTPDPVTAHVVRRRRSVAAAMSRVSGRLTVELQGSCVGAGVELASFAGRVVARPGTTLRLPEVAMGLVPGAGGTVGLTRRIGRHATARLCLLGDEVDLDEAVALGLVDTVSDEV